MPLYYPNAMIYTTFDFLHVLFDAECQAAHMQWKDFAQGEDFRNGLNAGLALVQEKALKNWLADLRQMAAINPDDEVWSNTDWFPRAIGAGLQNMAIVPSTDIFNQISVESIMSQVPGTAITVHYFSTPEEARTWLKAQLGQHA
jgi:hypothetical protein